MTTSDHPRTDRRDDDPGEHRGLGKRILDAVLGDPVDERHDPTGRPAGAAHPDRPADTAPASPASRRRVRQPGRPGRRTRAGGPRP